MNKLSMLSRLGAMLAVLGAVALPVSAATVTLVAGNGFSDATPRAPEGGNTGTTLGQQRTNLFNAAAQVWGTALSSTQTIKVQAAFETLTCSAGSGTLGSAGATGNYVLTDGVDDRYYAVALAEALTGQNLNATASNVNEISATFNARVDLDDTGCLGTTRFYYGLIGPTPAGTIALYPVLLHELGHGLGFAAFICRTNPQCTNTTPATPYGAYFFNVPDVWSDTIRDNNIDGLGTNRRWSELTTAERVISFTHDPLLVWNGMTVSSNIAGQAAVAKNEDRLRMYAPATFVPGSSISHFHSDASPDLLMEPSLTAGVFTQTDLTDCLLADIGWIDSRCATVINATPTLNALASPVNVLEDAGTQVVNLSGIGDNDALVQELSVAAVSSNTALIPNPTVTYTNPNSTGSISYTPQPNQNGSAVITVGVFDDGGWANGGNDLVTRQFTVNVTAVNDAPVISSSPPTTATEAVAYNYAPTATDVDGPGQTWSLVSPTHTCGGSINGSSGAFTFTPAGPTPPANCVVALQVCDGGTPNLCVSQSTTVVISAVNNAPVITSSASTTATEDIAYSYNATRNDPDGPGQTWSLISPTHTCGGTINAATGAFTFTPAGPVPAASCVVVVQVCDGATPNLCATQSTTVTITAVNDAPVINSSAPTTATEDVSYSYSATRDDLDGPSQSWTLVAPTHTCNGSINVATGAFTFTPAGPVPPASCVVAVQVCDGASPSLCATQSTTVTISASNDAPVITSSAPTTATEDIAYSYNATRDDLDGPSQGWSLSGAHTCGGSIVAATGVFTFTPTGPVPVANCVIALQVCDGASPSLCATQSTTIAITSVNDAPVITSSAPTTATEDIAYSYNPTRNDPDGPGQTWSLISPTHTCGGSINAATGAFTFTPAGPVPPANCVVAVQVCDGATPNLCATQSTTIAITAVNDAPMITSSAATTATEDIAYSYNPTRSDPDGPGQTWTLISPTHTCGGSINAATGAFAFTPAGPVPLVNCVVALQVCDGATPSLCATQSTTITITAVNDAPVITSSASTTATEDSVYSYNPTRNDPDGPGQTWSLISPTHTCGGSINAATGAFAFTPAGPVPLANCVVALQVCDGATPSLCATQSTTITITAVNDAPVITSSAPPTATEDTVYSYNPTRSDLDGPGQTWNLISPTHTCGGSINAATGAFAFTPVGPVPPASCVVALQVCDGASPSLCATQSTTVTISASNDAPVITSSAPTTATEDIAYSYNATRDDPDSPGQSWTLVSPTHTCGGSINGSSGAFAFTPAGPVAPASCVVAVQVCDDATPSLCATQTTTVAITAVNDAPVISSIAPTFAIEDALYTYSGSRNDPDGPSQNWSLSGTHTCGGSIVPATGVFTFTPSGPTPPASCVVSVEVCDSGTPNLCSGAQTTSITITALNDPPVVTAPVNVGAGEDAVRSFSGTDRLGLGDADSVTVQVTLSVDHGSLSLGALAGVNFVDGDGTDDPSMRFNATPSDADAAVATLSFRPTADYNGSATLDFSVDDGVAAPVQRTIGISITAEADIVDDFVSVLEDGNLVFNVISGTQGASADSFEGVPVLAAIGSASHGSTTFAAEGNVSYTPTANFSGVDTFSYTVSSGGVSESGSITVTIAAVNDPPTLNAIPDPILIGVNAGQQTINLGGIGPGGGETAQTLIVTAASDNPGLIPNPGVTYTSPNAAGTLTFTPQPGQVGTAIITVTVTDSGGTTNGGINTVSRSFTQVVGVLDRIFANGFQQP